MKPGDKVKIIAQLWAYFVNEALEKNGWIAEIVSESKDQTGRLTGYICKTPTQVEEFFVPTDKAEKA